MECQHSYHCTLRLAFSSFQVVQERFIQEWLPAQPSSAILATFCQQASIELVSLESVISKSFICLCAAESSLWRVGEDWSFARRLLSRHTAATTQQQRVFCFITEIVLWSQDEAETLRAIQNPLSSDLAIYRFSGRQRFYNPQAPSRIDSIIHSLRIKQSGDPKNDLIGTIKRIVSC